jgi:transcriptional regulator with XRE-family HTH domain/quercetin dioxygenase-like cupin family protein
MSEKDGQGLSSIGKKLRAARLRQRLSLRELAERAEVSASLLSKVENSKANPSVRSLHSIADALSLPVNYFFPEEGDSKIDGIEGLKEVNSSEVVNMTAGQLRAARAAALIDLAELGFDDGQHPPKEPVIRSNARPTIELLGGINWQRLTPGPERGIEFLHICYKVGAKSGEKMSHHSGREFQYVLEGELLLELGFEQYLLKAGDSIIFDSTTPHRLSNAGDVPLRAISVIFNNSHLENLD